jgi:hypothetical protein
VCVCVCDVFELFLIIHAYLSHITQLHTYTHTHTRTAHSGLADQDAAIVEQEVANFERKYLKKRGKPVVCMCVCVCCVSV